MVLTGGCHCGAIRYAVTGEPERHGLCYCLDCQRCAGAPVVAWAAFAEAQVTVTKGSPVFYASSEHTRRGFCGACGTGLLYRNAHVLPGIVDIQTATLDNPAALSPPRSQVQTADRIPWMETAHTLPAFPRYPGG